MSFLAATLDLSAREQLVCSDYSWHAEAGLCLPPVIDTKRWERGGITAVSLARHASFVGLATSDDGGIQVGVTGYAVAPTEWPWPSPLPQDRRPSSLAELLAGLASIDQVELIREVNGVYAAVIWSNKRESATLLSDRLGVRPLFWTVDRGRLLVASRSVVLAQQRRSVEIDRVGVDDTLVFGFLTENRTLWQEISRVPGGTIVTVTRSGSHSRRYWSADEIIIDDHITLDDAIDGHEERFRRALDRLLELDRQPSCFVSGGMDSRRLLTGLAQRANRVDTFTIARINHRDPYESDLGIGRALANFYDMPWAGVPFYEPEREGELALLTYFINNGETFQHRQFLPLMARLPHQLGVNYDGLAGDILVYDEEVTPAVLAAQRDPGRLADFLRPQFDPDTHGVLSDKPSIPNPRERLINHLTALPDNDNRYSLWYLSHWTPRRTAPWGATVAAVRTESVFPYLDHEVMEYSLTVPQTVKLNTNMQQLILERYHADVMTAVPSSHYPNIHTTPDAVVRPYVQPVPKAMRTRRILAHYAAAADQIRACPWLWERLTAQSKQSVAMLRYGRSILSIVPSLVERAWRLDRLGQVAVILQGAEDRAFWQQLRERATVYLTPDDAEL